LCKILKGLLSSFKEPSSQKEKEKERERKREKEGRKKESGAALSSL
jgi:hypothetical protein